MDIRKIQIIDQLIRLKQTGTPKQLALKLDCSERTVFKYLEFLKKEMGAPIDYNTMQGTYQYTFKGVLTINNFEKR